MIDSPFIEGWGGTIGYEMAYTPAITNDIGDRHASGGHRITASFAVTF